MSYKQYKAALSDAVAMMEATDLEPTSALKQAASDNGIAYGNQMAQFVNWAWYELFGEQRYNLNQR